MVLIGTGYFVNKAVLSKDRKLCLENELHFVPFKEKNFFLYEIKAIRYWFAKVGEKLIWVAKKYEMAKRGFECCFVVHSKDWGSR